LTNILIELRYTHSMYLDSFLLITLLCCFIWATFNSELTAMNSLLSIIIFINLFIDLDQRSSQVVAYNKLFRLKFGDFYTIDTVRKKILIIFF